MTWVIVLVVFLIFLGLIKFTQDDSTEFENENTKIAIDYSFGNDVIKRSKELLEKGEFEKAKDEFFLMNSDLLTQAIDCICLNGEEETLLKWQTFNPDLELPKLFLGAFYLHQAWISRGYQKGYELNDSQVLGFVEYLGEAERYLSKIKSSPSIILEAKSRLIRVYMGQSKYEKAEEAFEYCFDQNPEHTWSYLHLIELIQPKWGGSTALVKSYLDRFSPNSLQYRISSLKLIWDSFTWENNVFGGSMIELNDFAFETAKGIHEEIKVKPPKSIHKFVLFNYMEVIFQELGYQDLAKHYEKLRANYLTLYPYGIVMH